MIEEMSGGRNVARIQMRFMIRAFESSDMFDVLNIWLKASVRAHGFVAKEFWESRVEDMREIYIPASETYVFSENGAILGFFSEKKIESFRISRE